MPPLSYRSPKTVTQPSPIHGTGLFASAAIARGEIVAIKGGYIFNSKTLAEVEVQLGPAEIAIADGLFIGPRFEQERDGSMIYTNHSCEPNIGIQGQIVFVAMRDIRPGEELTHDWATTDDDHYEMQCRCGAKTCRGTITGQDWLRKDLQTKYQGYFSWYLQQKMAAGSGQR